MSEIIERVARRLADVHFRRKKHSGACTQDERVAWLANAYWRNHVSAAIAAIEAMRVPNPAMCEAAIETGAVNNDEFYIKHDDIRTLMDAMITVALGNKP